MISMMELDNEDCKNLFFIVEKKIPIEKNKNIEA